MTGCEPSADAAKAPYSCLSGGPPCPLRPPGRAGRAPGRLQRLRADAKPGRGGIRFQDGAGAGGLPVTPLGVVVRPRRLCACGLASTSPPPSPAIPINVGLSPRGAWKTRCRAGAWLLYSDKISPNARPDPFEGSISAAGCLEAPPREEKAQSPPCRSTAQCHVLWTWPGGATRYRCATAFSGRRPTSSPKFTLALGSEGPRRPRWVGRA